MELEKIVIISDEKDLERVEKVIESIRQINPSFVTGKIIYGRLGKDTLLSFNIEKQHYKFMVDKLKLNKVKVISKIDAVEEKKQKAYKSTAQDSKGTNWSPTSRMPLNKLRIQELALQGRYNEIIKITKDVRNGQQNIDEAKRLLPDALDVAIETALSDFFKFEHRQEGSIEVLLDISANSFLKTPNYMEYVKKAATSVVDLLCTRRDQLYELIHICNNNKIHHIGPVKAAVKFVEMTFDNPIIFDSEIDYAVKKLNLQWILICFPVVEHELTEPEKNSFSRLVELIRSKR